VVEAAFAGSLGIRLGGTNRYHGSLVEHRALLGDGRAPVAADVRGAVHLARRVGLGAALCAVGLASLLRRPAARPVARRPPHP
jgi:adenosylcobinamide-phosphate synthase